MNSVVSVSNLSFGYNGEILLKNVSLSLSHGSLLVICGLSGQGKSTLLRCIIGLEKPRTGKIILFNNNISMMSKTAFNQLKSKIGFVFQNSALLSTQSVENNLRLPLIYHGLASKKDINEMVENTLEKLLLKEYRKKYPGELSLGLQKRTAMARAIITDPKLILMDEPTTGLDNISKGVFISLIQNIRLLNNAAMIMVTNDLFVAREMGGEIGVLKEGELLEPMEYATLKQSPDAFVQSLLVENMMK